MKSTLLLLSALPVLGACASTSREEQPAPPEAARAAEKSASLVAGSTPVPVEAIEAAMAQAGTAAGPADELSVWDDPDFRRQLDESYLSETEIEPRVIESEREQMQQVYDQITADRLDKAAALLAKFQSDASSAVFDFTLANIHFQREELAPAAEAYEVAVAKFPKFRRAWKNLGLIRVRQNEFPEALVALRRVIELGGGDALTYGLLGFAYSNLEDDFAAESAYRMANLLDPATLDWKMGLARSFFRQKRFADAVALCGNLIEGAPERADLWLLQANAYIGLGQPMRAAENYAIVERMGQSTTDSLNMLADIYVNEGLHELAAESYLAALERDPEARAERALRAAKVMTAGGALEETKHLVERIQALRAEQLTTEERKDLLRMRARIALAQDSGDEEARVLEEIVALDPLDGDALILLGQHARRTGEHEKAIFYFERAANLEAFEADAKVRHAQLLVDQGRYSEALPLLRRAQNLKPRDNIQQYLEQVERIAQSRLSN